MKVFITGSNGQVASELLRLANSTEFTVFAKSKQELDITQREKVFETIKNLQPNIVINTAAYTQVDQAEESIETTYTVNRNGAKHLAMACEYFNIPLLHISTDYVFNGAKKIPYIETDAVSPLNIYGKSKWEGEEEVRNHCSRHIILRTSAVFGVQGINFVKTMLRLSQQNEIIKVVNDQTICPTPAAAIADALWKICKSIQTNHKWGTYHFCGDQAVTWYDFARMIITEAHPYLPVLTRDIQPISSKEYITRAQRPSYSVLDCGRLENNFGIEAANWHKGLVDVITRLYK